EHKVGYGKPPVHTRFCKGRSGNPGGRPRGMTAGRAAALALKEAYRLVTVREGDKVLTVPAIQAVLRSQVALAAQGNGPAQRALSQSELVVWSVVSRRSIPRRRSCSRRRKHSSWGFLVPMTPLLGSNFAAL